MKPTNKLGLKQDFFDKLVELGVYEKWEKAYLEECNVSDIPGLNKNTDFRDFINQSFTWVRSEDGDEFWNKISEK